MSDHVLAFDDHVEAIERESGRLVTVGDRTLGRTVPTCPEWSGLDLTDHVGSVFTFWAGQLRAADPVGRAEVDQPAPGEGEDPMEWLHERAERLVSLLRELGPNSPCWNWSGQAFDSAWVARRMALEVAVHRYDAELTAGDPTPIATGLAADGLDERIEVHLRADVPDVPEASLGGSLGLKATDDPVGFVVEVGGGRLHVRSGGAPASAYVRGPASDLFLFSWNRVGLDRLELTGERRVAEAWQTLPN